MIQENVSLLPFNTFGIPVQARRFSVFRSVAELQTLLKSGVRPVFILGGGSNILFGGDVNALVLKNEIPGIEVTRRFKRRVWVRVGGGVVWHEFVQWAVAQNYGGVENMSLIPGTVGAAPIQNIGAYGAELKQVFLRLEAVELATGKRRIFSADTCRFGYRDSFFKREGRGKFCITAVTFSLTLPPHKVNVAYGDIKNTLAQMGVENPGIAEVSKAVVHIRQSKLPDPAVIGNCGSFFKNPEVEHATAERVRANYPQMPAYDLPDGRVKIPAGWLIEQCGWKGKRVGNTGAYEKQALVLVNYGGATGDEVVRLAHDIMASVKEKFGVEIEPEVNIV